MQWTCSHLLKPITAKLAETFVYGIRQYKNLKKLKSAQN